MKRTETSSSIFQAFLLLTISIVSSMPSLAAEPRLELEQPAQAARNRVSLGFQIGFNMPVTFKNLGGYAALSTPKMTLDNDPYNYDNGYVLRDSSFTTTDPELAAYTSYWGYDPGTVMPGGNTIVLERSSAEASAKATRDSEVSPGFQLDYNRELIKRDSWQGGLGVGFAYARLDLSDSSPQWGDSTLAKTTFGFPEGVDQVPGNPSAGNYGRKEGGGGVPVIIAEAQAVSSTRLINGQAITGNREFQANLYRFRLGPWVDYQLSKDITLSFSGGFALAYVESDFKFDETVTVGNLTPVSHRGNGSQSAWMPGGYVAGNLAVALSEKWSAFGGIEFQSLGRYSHTVNGKEAVLDLTKSLYATLGVSYSF